MNEAPEEPRRFQFTIFRLFLLTLVVAIVLAIAMAFEAPFIARVCIGIYLMAFATWVVMRGPGLIDDFRRILRERKRLREKRRQLEDDIAKRRENKSKGEANDDNISQ